MKRPCAFLALVLAATPASAAVLAASTYDVDSYMFIGLNTNETGLTLTLDFSNGVIAQNNSHFVFSVIKFENLAGLTTKASGGGEKYLKLTTATFPGYAKLGVTAAMADIDANDATGYPSGLFPGNPIRCPPPLNNRNCLNTDRLDWYLDNIRSDIPVVTAPSVDNPNPVAYTGGAKHVGFLEFTEPGSVYLKVTDTVDSWINGSRPNHGFGLWGIDVSGGQTDPFDLTSSEHASGNGPQLVSSLPGSATVDGDTNEDGVVDVRDVVRLLNNYGRTSGVGIPQGDLNEDGVVNLLDLAKLQSNFTPPASGGSPAAVPEPSGWLLGASGMLLAWRRTRRQLSNIRRQRNR